MSTFASSLLGLILLLALWSWFKKESKSEKWKPANGGFGQYVEEPAVPDFCAPEELEVNSSVFTATLTWCLPRAVRSNVVTVNKCRGI